MKIFPILILLVSCLLTACSSEPIAQQPIQPTPTPSLRPTPDETEHGRRILSDIKLLLRKGQAMRLLPLDDCMGRMRSLQLATQYLADEAGSAAPESPIRTRLAPAATDLKMCVTCSETLAPGSCNQVADAVKDAEQFFGAN